MPFPGCANVAGKLRQMRLATAGAKFIRPGNGLIVEPCIWGNSVHIFHTPTFSSLLMDLSRSLIRKPLTLSGLSVLVGLIRKFALCLVRWIEWVKSKRVIRPRLNKICNHGIQNRTDFQYGNPDTTTIQIRPSLAASGRRWSPSWWAASGTESSAPWSASSEIRSGPLSLASSSGTPPWWVSWGSRCCPIVHTSSYPPFWWAAWGIRCCLMILHMIFHTSSYQPWWQMGKCVWRTYFI